MGCVSTPQTHITGNLKNGTFNIKAPKDYLIGTLDVSANTNGVVTVHLSNLNATNNPQVITSSASGQVDIINATGAVAANVAGQVAKALVKP